MVAGDTLAHALAFAVRSSKELAMERR